MLLRDKDRQALLEIAATTLKTPVEIWAYGSRVNGDAHDTSDLDLVIRTTHLTPLDHSELHNFITALDDSNIPILIQAFDWSSLPESFHHNILQKYEILKTFDAT